MLLPADFSFKGLNTPLLYRPRPKSRSTTKPIPKGSVKSSTSSKTATHFSSWTISSDSTIPNPPFPRKDPEDRKDFQGIQFRISSTSWDVCKGCWAVSSVNLYGVWNATLNHHVHSLRNWFYGDVMGRCSPISCYLLRGIFYDSLKYTCALDYMLLSVYPAINRMFAMKCVPINANGMPQLMQ